MSNIIKALKLLIERGDQLVDLIEKTPEALHSAGEGIESAGKWANKVSHGLSSEGSALTLSGVLDDLSDAAKKCKLKLSQAASTIDGVAILLGGIKIPTIEFTRKKIKLGTWERYVVVDIDIGEQTLFGEVKKKLQAAADDLQEVSNWFDSASQGFEKMMDISDRTAEQAAKIGDRLEAGGQNLQETFAE